MNQTQIKNFAEKAYPEKCIEWSGCDRGNGYGAFNLDGKTESPHKLVLEAFLGRKLKEGIEITMHSCDNRKCVNLRHLSVGSHSDNTKDAYQKGRMKGPPPKIVAPEGLAWCKACKCFQEIQYFTKDSSRPNGLEMCKQCKREKNQKYQKRKEASVI